MKNAGEGGQDHRLRVCLVVDTLGYDAGTEKLVAEIAQRIDAERFEVHVCCFENSARLAALPARIHTVIFPVVRIYSPAAWREILRFRRYLTQHKLDVVHGFMTKSNIFAVLGAVRSSCRMIVTSRFNIGYAYNRRSLQLLRLLNRFTTHILANSQSAKKSTADMEGVSPEKISVFYPGVDLLKYDSSAGDPMAASSLGIPPGVPAIGITATFRPVKDLPLFLSAARLVLATVPDTAVILIGHGQLKDELETLATELGIRQNVFLTNRQGKVADYLARLSVACLTSKSESLPNAILEYMAAGLPVVATDVGGVSELIEHGSTGYLVIDRTPKAVAEPIIRLLTHPSLRSEMGRRSRERAQTHFDLAVAVKRLESFYDAARAMPRPPEQR